MGSFKEAKPRANPALWYTGIMRADISSPATLPPLEPLTSHSDRVAESIKTAILRGTLQPNEVLVERRLAAMLGVSKTPVREALIMLASRGLVTLTRNRGMTVRSLTLDEVRHVYEERVLVEPWAVARAVESERIDFAAADRALAEAASVEDGERTELRIVNRRFHRALYAACENQFVVSALDGLQDLTVLAIAILWERWPTWQSERIEHQEILVAARAGDAAKAEALMRVHIDRSLSRLNADRSS